MPSITASTNAIIFGPAYYVNSNLRYAEYKVIDVPEALSSSKPKSLSGGGGQQQHQDAIPWGGKLLDIPRLEGHFLNLGMTGSGKSLQANIALRSVIRNIFPGSDRKVIIFDTKGDIIRIVAGLKRAGEVHVSVHLMSLNDQRAVLWDVGADCKRYDKAKDISMVFIPEQEHSGDKFWQDASRAIVVYIIQAFIYRRGRNWGLHDVYNAALTTIDNLEEILKWHPRGQDVIDFLLQTDSPQTVSGIKSQLFTQLERLSFAAAATQYAKSLISLEEFLQTEGILIISQDFTAREASNPYISACFQRLVELITALPDSKTRKIFIFLDECRFLGKLPKFLELVTFCRSKGVHAWMSSQGIEGMKAVYGEEVTDEIFNQAEYKTFTSMDSPKTAEWCTNLVGPVPLWEPAFSSSSGQGGSSSSVQYQFRKKDRILVRDLLELPLPNRSTGLWSYHRSKRMTPDFFAAFTDAETIARLSPPQDPSTPVQIPRPNEQLYVRPWSEAERKAFMREIFMDTNVSKDAAATDSNSGQEEEDNSYARQVARGVFDMAEEILKQAIHKAWNRHGKGGGGEHEM